LPIRFPFRGPAADWRAIAGLGSAQDRICCRAGQGRCAVRIACSRNGLLFFLPAIALAGPFAVRGHWYGALAAQPAGHGRCRNPVALRSINRLMFMRSHAAGLPPNIVHDRSLRESSAPSWSFSWPPCGPPDSRLSVMIQWPFCPIFHGYIATRDDALVGGDIDSGDAVHGGYSCAAICEIAGGSHFFNPMKGLAQGG